MGRRKHSLLTNSKSTRKRHGTVTWATVVLEMIMPYKKEVHPGDLYAIDGLEPMMGLE
jgi:hypothetical protein